MQPQAGRPTRPRAPGAAAVAAVSVVVAFPVCLDVDLAVLFGSGRWPPHGRLARTGPGDVRAVGRGADRTAAGAATSSSSSTTSATSTVTLSGAPARSARSTRRSAASCGVPTASTSRRVAPETTLDSPSLHRRYRSPTCGAAQQDDRLDLDPAVERLQEQRALRVGARLVVADPALVDERLHERLVVGQLLEDAVAQQVAAGVAHLRDRRPGRRPGGAS